ncbi:MAG: glycoside hydrolase family 127 protein [Pirellulales bacterium]|nr:glycoside hydrolase family 127 protein [Pirellulales bacterium]
MAKLWTGFLFSCLLLGFFGNEGLSADRTEGAPGRATPCLIPPAQVRLRGEIETRYLAATRNVLARSDRYSLDSFVANASGRPGALWWDWPGDQIGRWFSVLHVAGGYGWPDAAALREAALEAILPHQTKEGNFGPPGSAERNDSRIPSGNAFALRGMMDAYADTHDPRYLESARKLARYFQAIAPQWETREGGRLHEFYGHCIDGLVALYEQGGDREALDLAERLAPGFGPSSHTHHALSLCRGLIDLARVTGKGEYLEKADAYLSWCRDHQTVSGGLPEMMPYSEQDEGCGLADWIVVNLMMYEATGRDCYLDEAEHTLVNHFFMNQFSTGGFGHRSFSQEIVGGKHWQGWEGKFGSENPGCCSFWGSWALGQVGRYIVTQSGETVSVNLYPSAEITLPERGVKLEISGDFPRMSKAQIRVECTKPQSFTLALRIPPWSRSMKVTCNGVPVAMPEKGNRVLLKREWKGISTIYVDFAIELRLVSWPARNPKGVAVFDGPLCLGLSSDSADLALPWTVAVDAAGRPVVDAQGRPQVVDPSGNKKLIEPINSKWQDPDVKNPARWRILFRTLKSR